MKSAFLFVGIFLLTALGFTWAIDAGRRHALGEPARDVVPLGYGYEADRDKVEQFARDYKMTFAEAREYISRLAAIKAAAKEHERKCGARP